MKALREMNAQRMPEDRYLELLATGWPAWSRVDSKRLIVNLPPRHFKTWIGSVSLSAWMLGRDPSAKILIVTYGAELADKIAHTIREKLAQRMVSGAVREDEAGQEPLQARGLCHHRRRRRSLGVD